MNQPPAGIEPPLPDSPSASEYPDAYPIEIPDANIATIDSDTQKRAGTHYLLDGHVVLHYQTHTVEADHIDYDNQNGEVIANGHVLVTGGDNDERIHASHATLNVQSGTGRFYDVSGSVGMKPVGERMVYANGNPFLFTGRVVIKTGPQAYQVYDGTVTSCQLPNPDWLFSAAKFTMDGQKARGTNSVFHLLNIPILYLPYVTHPVNAEDRQTGILIPEVGFNSASKGDTLGEQIYWAINRSTDLTVGTIFYSARGWEQSASLRYRGLGQDFARAHYSGLHDRGYYPGGVYVNQSGTDVTLTGRHDLFVDDATLTGLSESQPTQTRLVADVEYLSSFQYREAFSTNFNQAVSSDVISTLYGTREWNGFAASVEGDKYQGEKRVATTATTTAPAQTEEQVHIFHAPSLEFATTDHALGSTGLEWSFDSTVAGLKRTQPNFTTSGIIERLDFRPQLAYPLFFKGWSLRPSIATRETFYSRSRLLSPDGNQAAAPSPTGPVPVESATTLNRSDFEVEVDLRPPVLERVFDSGYVKKLFRRDVRHTIEPELTYRYVTGIDNFLQVLRFDQVDIASDTNEVEYGVTQRLFLSHTGGNPCKTSDSAADSDEVLGPAPDHDTDDVDAGEPLREVQAAQVDNAPTSASAERCGNREWISWRLTQKSFIASRFGGAIVNGRRNILDTTLNLSGIAFLTEPRNISPLISRLRVRTSEKIDVEWDFDFDTGAKKFTADNVFVDVHQGSAFAGISLANLSAPGRAYIAGVASAAANFNQVRFLLGFGKPTRAGFSAAANAGIDLNFSTVQYAAVQTSYNWNCCGVSVEYRQYNLGTVRNDSGYKFNFTLANIGTAGNLRRSQQVF